MNTYVVIFFLLFINILFPTVMNFVDIDSIYYINYLMWINLLLFLYFVIPSDNAFL